MLRVLLGFILLLVLFALSLQLKPVQNFLAQRASSFLSKELETRITLGSIYFRPFNAIEIHQLYIEDRDQDTLLYVDSFLADIDISSIWNSKLTMSGVSVTDGSVYIKRQADSSTNFSFIQEYFSSDKKPDAESKKFDFVLPDARLENMNIRYRNFLAKETGEGIDFNDLSITGLSGRLEEIDYVKHLFQARVEGLTFREKSGLYVKKLDTRATIDSNRMEFDALDLAVNSSYIRDYLLLEYPDFSAFSDFINQVSLSGNLLDSRLTSKDIAFFAPKVNVTNFDVLIRGKFSGRVNDLSGSNVQIRTGKQTWLQGDLSIKGLPEIEQTLFNLDLSQLITTRTDLEKLVADLSGKELFELPAIFDRFGKVSYQGNITGFYNDFITKGIFKTEIGDVIADINLELTGNGRYSGELLTHNFNLGSLIQDDKFGLLSLRANAVGEGFTLENLKEDVEAKVAFFDFNGYRYRDITIDGVFSQQVFAGNIDIRDEHLRASLEGNLNISNSAPGVNFTALVDTMDLRVLNLSEDSLSFAAGIRSDLKGNSLNNLTGSLRVSDFRIAKSTQSTFIDSILVSATGTENERLLYVQSDIVDATIRGQFDLNNFPSYFKSVAKRYIPSWKTTIVAGGKQEFDVELVVKDFAPLALVFAPDVLIPDEVIITGVFSSERESATLNGFVPSISYKGIKANNLIFDQTTNEQNLNVFITSDRIDISDSLYINNVNFANVLRDDSLHFNIKLSDMDATNQLDLNGLVEFGEPATQLSLLPSDVIINQQEWKIEEQVRIGFSDGKIQVNDLELSQGNQLVVINGILSNQEEDAVSVRFEDFLLETLNPLTRSAGIELAGLMNGSVEVRSAFQRPFIQSNITANDITYNQIGIGDLNLAADFDQTSRLVNMEASIDHLGQQTLLVEGTYNAMDEENSLDLEMRLNESQLVVFSPFLRKLVSDLSGTITANLSVSGTPLSPVITGSANFNDAGMVVNYLQAPYRLNDEVEVENSVIVLKNTQLRDHNNRTAVANGTVDMSTPLNPTINVDIQADNFMVLNTTAKDNPLYYGIAYGTGSFRFHGPTDDMDITIEARTNEGTVINIPLNAAGTITDQDFITFVSKDSTAAPRKTNYFQGMTMAMDLSVSPDAEINIYTDLGKLSGKGDGLISMNITALGDFEMFGDYAIQEGEFEFTAQDFINKIFEIDRGGSIRWTGNPVEALINLTAVYQVRTSVGPLYTAAGRSGTDQRVMAQAEMILNGNLLRPDITFDIDFPTDSYVKDELQSYLSDANNVNQQALSLIVRRSFAPGTGTDLTRELNTTVFSAGTELAFNQLNNIISQSLNLNFVDFNIRSFNEASASIRLLNDRLILTGGVTDRRGQLNDLNVFGKDIASDVEALYLIRKSGNLLLRASNRLNNRNFLNPEDEYVSAVGLVYRQEFDTFGEFFRRLTSFSRPRFNPYLKPEETSDSTATDQDTVRIDIK